jgi:hypothetical protein
MANATIEVDEKVAAALRAQAELRHIPVSTFLQHLIQLNVPIPGAEPLNNDDWDRAIDEVSGDFPVLPADFSRADIYSDHD